MEFPWSLNLLSVAHRLGCAAPLSWQDIVRGDETSLCLLLAAILTGSAAGGRWGAQQRIDQASAGGGGSHLVPPSPAKARIEGKAFKVWEPAGPAIAEGEEEEDDDEMDGDAVVVSVAGGGKRTKNKNQARGGGAGKETEQERKARTLKWKMLPVAEDVDMTTDIDEWFVMEGVAGAMRGPMTMAEAMVLVDEGSVTDGTLLSHNGIWAPLTSWRQMGWLEKEVVALQETKRAGSKGAGDFEL